MSLKQRTISGLLWSFTDAIAKVSITFISNIILAHLLTPREYGLIGMTTIFIAISQSFVDSGFRQALIRKNNCTQADYSTVFYFNLLASLVFYLILFVFANFIGHFFKEPQLGDILRVLGLGLVINALALVQQTQLVKNIDFKLQTQISIVSSVVSGIISVCMAFMGYGVWSLVALTLSNSSVSALLLWLWRGWKPSLVFSWVSFREMFAFGSRLLISGLINTLYQNIYNLIIGRYFSAVDLGYYSQAITFRDLPSLHLTSVVQRVSYPVLATLQDDLPHLRAAYRKVIQNMMLITFVLMLGMAAVAEPLLITLVGEQWRSSIVYLQLLCFVGMLYPLQAINLNMLQVQGRSDLVLRLEVIKKFLSVPVIVIGIFFGIQVMIVCMFVNSLIAYYLNAYWSGKFIGYSMIQQIKDLLPSLVLAATMALIVYFFGCVFDVSNLSKLILQIGLGAALTVGLAELTHLDSYLSMKAIVLAKLWKRVYII